MSLDLVGLELVGTISFLYCIHILLKGAGEKPDIQFAIHCVVLSAVYIPLNLVKNSHPILRFIVQLTLLFIHIRVYYHNRKLFIFSSAFCIYVFWDILRLTVILLAFPYIYLWGVKSGMLLPDIVFVCIQLLLYTLVVIVFKKKKWKFGGNVSRTALFGFVFICMVLEMAILLFRSLTYSQEETFNYEILLLGISCGCIVIVLWLIDKREEQRKIQELTSYVHKTREVIPSVGRMLDRLEQSSEHMEKAGQIIEELRSICDADMQGTQKELSGIKTFASTGCFVLDEQLKRYLEEAWKEDFVLDIIVRATVNEILDTNQIDRYRLLQLVGDLYRNAYKVVKTCSGGRILICFGYNMEGFYEIAFYDNGALFPPYILNHLGERGVTTGGTGHGIADIFEVLEKNHGSFILNQKMPENSIFRKGICIVFDSCGRIEVHK